MEICINIYYRLKSGVSENTRGESMFTISKGMPILGCQLRGENGCFGIYSTEAYSMVLKIYEQVYEDTPLLEVILNRQEYTTGDVFHIAIEGIKEGYSYTWQTKSKENEESIPLIDPYARSLHAFPKGSNHYKNIVVKDTLYIGKRPQIPWKDTIIYELHVGAFTKGATCGLDDREKGTFEGIIRKLPYLKKLGA